MANSAILVSPSLLMSFFETLVAFLTDTFNVYDNQMTGTIPGEGSRLRQMFYMDLGRNRFSGTIPATLADEYVRLRYLYLDHNRFTGALPSDLMDAGGGRLKAISVNDNQFRGESYSV